MKYWLIKTEPSTYSWDDFVKLKRDHWDGVRNYAARLHLNAMKKGDLALFYHSVKAPGVVGIAKVVKESYQDPTTDDTRWVCVDVKVERALKRKVTLAEVREVKSLKDMILLNNSRLSVQPVLKKEFDTILKLSEKTPK